MLKIYLYIDIGYSVFLNLEIILNIYFLLYVICLFIFVEKNNIKCEIWNDVFLILLCILIFVV